MDFLEHLCVKTEEKEMADIRPFRCIRPSQEMASRVAALPYDVYSREEAKKEIEREPLSFLRVDRAETWFPDTVDTYAPCVYEKARDVLHQMIRDGIFIEEEKPCYYLYELTRSGRVQTGIVACSSVDDYLNNVIKNMRIHGRKRSRIESVMWM